MPDDWLRINLRALVRVAAPMRVYAAALWPMKRCPTEQGGCGQLVDYLFDSGLCSACDGAVKRGEAAAGGAPKRRAGRRKARGPRGPYKKKGGDSDAPKPKRKYVRRSVDARPAGYPKVIEKATTATATGSALVTLQQMRVQYSEERESCLKAIAMLETRLEVLDDIEKRLNGVE